MSDVRCLTCAGVLFEPRSPFMSDIFYDFSGGCLSISRFTDIKGWQSARELVRAVYSITSEGTFARDFALRDQIRRAAVSGMSNIAEGFDRGSDPDFARFLDMARASITEVKSLLFVALDQGYVTQETFDLLMQHGDKTQALIAAFTTYLRNPRVREEPTSAWQ